MTYYKKLTLFAALLWIASQPLLAQSSVEGERYIVDLGATDYAYDMPSEIQSGWVTLRFRNEGSHYHNSFIARIADSVSTTSVKSMLKEYDYSFINYITGGPGVHSPGATSEITLNIKPGRYAMVCFRKNPDHSYHLDKGMVHFFEATDSVSTAPEPSENIVLTQSRYDLAMRGAIRNGLNTFKITFDEAIGGGFHLARVPEAGDLSKALDALEIEQVDEIDFVGGSEPAATGREVYMTYDLEKGRYAWINYYYGAFGINRIFNVPASGSRNLEPNEMSITDTTQLNLSLSEKGKLTGDFQIQQGPVRLTLENKDPDNRKIELQRMREGTSAGKVMAFFNFEAGSTKKEPPPNPMQGTFLEIPVSLEEEEAGLNIRLVEGVYAFVSWAKDEHDQWEVQHVQPLTVSR